MSIEAAKRAVVIAEVRPNGLAEPSNPNPNFNGPQWARLERDKILPLSSKPGLESVVMLATNPVNKEVITKNLTEAIPKIEDIKKELSYNPSKKSRQHVDNMGRLILIKRSRRGSRCLAQPDHEPTDCQGRRHLKKSKSENTQTLETKPMKNVKSEKPKKKSKQKDVILNGKKIK